ncbi:PEP-CTERM sorting domain-containing protein [Bythopirellula polymerisocia]|uniref:Ice-binding protein C-terminal domain-containing protein n=1 Tax=Bythopirellula polymerisocia TaxID=2528003 RepID=A0A5C6CXF4_9BACT|nr:PEP-CTERM sorting domain-containing protein [Bythopirellula polymerisocia]TWU28217.1 hypothetical protein Pla144_15040 [Bythopirellula polymerisocia]
MKRSLLLCSVCATLMALLPTANTQADNLQLTLDLNNTSRSNNMSGGSWTLWARVVDTGAGVDGSTGIAGLRALIDNITPTGITFNGAINANGAANTQVLPSDPEGTVEIVYGQDLSLATTAGIGVNSPATKDTLIASGTWPAGPRPVFGNDNKPTFPVYLSDGGFLAGGGAATVADSILTTVVTLGDFNSTGTISNADTAGYVAALTGGAGAYNPAGDFNQSGTVSNSDTGSYVAKLTGPLGASVAAVPEPSSIGLVMFGAMGLLGFRRNR